MPEKEIESISVKHISVLNETGEADSSLMPQVSDDWIKKAYGLLVLSRTFDERALNLQREGRIGTYASVLGQEASQIGSALAFTPEDWIFPSFREMAVYITLGYPMRMLYQYWSGDERGVSSPAGLNVFPVCVPVGTQIPHATGAGWAAKYKGHKIAVGCYFGDGGSSKGDFHEGLNFAGVFGLPVVYICQNNHWAISVPRSRQTASKTIAQKAYSYGFEGVQVDGNDIFAVYKATSEAVSKAKSGGGPTLIECFTYRMSDHTTADDASRYRKPDEVEAWRPKDPLIRLSLYMRSKGLLDDAYEKSVRDTAISEVDKAVREAEAIAPPDPKDMFIYTYGSLTKRQETQMKKMEP